MQKVIVTGATGFLGSHITQQLLLKKNFQVIGTTKTLIKAERLKHTLNLTSQEASRVQFLECDMVHEPGCFEKIIRDTKPQFVIHTASPFFYEIRNNTEAQQAADKTTANNIITKHYINAGRLLVREAVRQNVSRIIVTGSATSVTGVDNILESYEDASKWTTSKFEGLYNEYAKYAAEKICWDEILAAES